MPSGVLAVLEPATEAVLQEVPRADAVRRRPRGAARRRAFPAWRAVAPSDRAAQLRALSDIVREHLEELALLEARNAGKPIGDARGEMGMVAQVFGYYAGAPERLLGDTIPVAGGQAWTVREPLGVVGLIVPWNFPLTIAAWKLGPALAAGNTLVLKPAELTPLTALRFAELAPRGGPARGRAQRRRRAGLGVRRAAGRAPRRGQDRVHRLDRGRAARSPPARRRRSSA